jgi:colicin import membrane protein
MATAETSALALLETYTAVQLFAPGGLDPVVERIKAEVRAQAAELDISTDENRKAIKSLAYKVARSKTFIDEQRKALVADEKKRLAAIDAEGRRVWSELEELQVEVRGPLTEWENRDKVRIEVHERNLAEIQALAEVPLGASTEDIERRLKIASAVDAGRFEEFAKRAAGLQATAVAKLNADLILSREADAARIELERLRKEEQERAIREREQAAALKAKQEAETRAEAERKRVEQETARREAEARAAAEAERMRVEREREAAEERARKAEQDRIAAAKKAEEDRVAAARKAEEEKQAAVEAERARVAAEKERERQETEARERNKAHRAKINREAKSALEAAIELPGNALSSFQAEEIVKAIVNGRIPHVRIEY